MLPPSSGLTTTQCNNPDDHYLNSHHCENFKSYKDNVDYFFSVVKNSAQGICSMGKLLTNTFT